jgi:hypothetical protein
MDGKVENSSDVENDKIIFDINYKRLDKHRAREYENKNKQKQWLYNVSESSFVRVSTVIGDFRRLFEAGIIWLFRIDWHEKCIVYLK